MNKAIVIALLILRMIITPFYYLAGGGTKIVEIGERAQIGLTGIYITVLNYKRVYTSIEGKEAEPKKYIAFELLLDGGKERTSNFGHPVGKVSCHGERYNTYNMSGYFYVEGEYNSKRKLHGYMIDDRSICLFGKNLPILGIGKSEEKIEVAYGWVVFELPENFEINKFIYSYDEHSDLIKMLLPKNEIQIIFDNPIK